MMTLRVFHRRSFTALPLLAACAVAAACDRLGAAKTGDSAAATAADSSSARAPGGGRTLALPVVATAARDGDLVLSVTTTGQVRSDAQVALKAEVAGTVAQVLVRPGQRVTKGQPLVRLDVYPFDLAEREARTSLDEAQQRFDETVVPDSMVTGKGPTPEIRRALSLKHGVESARMKLERARWEKQRAVITAPVSGTVDRVDVAPGERITSGQAVATVVDLAHLRIEAAVLEHDLPLVKVGGAASVTSAGAPGRAITGRVDALLPLVDSTTRAGRAIIRLSGDGVLRPGMYADVRLEATRLAARRLVPASAVIERDGRPLVFVVREGRAQWVYIVPGRTNGVDTEVLADSSSGQIPVNAGDEVITDGHLTLTHDAPVRVVAQREAALDSSASVLRSRARGSTGGRP
ncbi:MAG: efflux RND transporter periplasmic adaptor subunit [Gemmatimonadaceae bacterium]|jgi:RND family efflux transporter MFP subunit|nr:efflux RND transporter periplasmic adaptor subunit [Gemmatimonadaceae bacterium]